MKVVIIIEGDNKEATVRYEIPKHSNTYTDTHTISKQIPIQLADVMMDAAAEWLKATNKGE